MTAYSATFADGSVKSLKNSRASYAAAWKVVTQEPGFSPITVSGFARDTATAEKAAQSEASRRMKANRWQKAATLISKEVVAVTAA